MKKDYSKLGRKFMTYMRKHGFFNFGISDDHASKVGQAVYCSLQFMLGWLSEGEPLQEESMYREAAKHLIRKAGWIDYEASSNKEKYLNSVIDGIKYLPEA